MDIFYEQNVANPTIDKHRKRTSILSVLRIVLLVIAVLFSFIMILYEVNVSSVFTAVVGIAIVLLGATPFVLAFIFLGKFINSTNTEYDYILNGNILRIVKVIKRNKRKLMATVQLAAVDSIGKVTCEAYERYASTKGIKKQFAVCDYENEENIVYVRYRNEGEDYLLHIEPDEEMVSSLRRSVPRISIMDKSMNAVNPVKKQ